MECTAAFRPCPFAGLSVASRQSLLHLQWLRRRADTASLLRRWIALYRELLRTPGGQTIAIQLTWYVAAVSDTRFAELRSVFHELGPVMAKHHMSTAQQLLNEGMQQGMARTETRQLERRFGPLAPTTLARLNNATVEELEAIAARLLDAPTLDAALRS